MIRPLRNEELVELAKLRIDHPYLLFFKWLFEIKNIIADFEHFYNIDHVLWVTVVTTFLLIPIYFAVGLWKIADFCDLFYAEQFFEFTLGALVIILYGFMRIPFVIYTYVRFSRANALIYMLKSD